MGLRIGKIAHYNTGSLVLIISEPVLFLFRFSDRKKSLFSFLLCGLLFAGDSFSQGIPGDFRTSNESLAQTFQAQALPFITTYTPDDYRAHIQNWGFMQADNGIMYAGNTTGTLEYDGISWRLISLPNGSPAKSLAKSTDGTIYTGGVRELGFLQPDSVGVMQFQSLLSHLDPDYLDFADIWFTYAIGNEIYFISDKYIFKWDGNRFNIWESDNGFGFASMVNDQIYIENSGVGLMRLEENSLVLVPDGDKFVDQPGSITAMLPYGNDKMLIGHFSEGLYLYDDQKFVPFKEEPVLQAKSIYSGTVLPNGDFVFVTLGNGCFIVDHTGTIKQWLGKQRGLASDTNFGAYADKSGNLWLAGENGINRVEVSSALRRFDEKNGLTEGVDRMAIYNSRFYASGKNGLFYLDEITSEPEKTDYVFQKIEGIEQQTWDLKPQGGYLLAANFNGLFQIDTDHQKTLLIPENMARITPSGIEPNRLFAGSMNGNVYSLQFIENQWHVEDSVLNIEGRVLEMTENPDGSLWISTRYNGVYKVDFSSSNVNRSFDEPYSLTHFDIEDGLPELSYNAVFRVQSDTYFSTLSGIYRFDNNHQKFTPDSLIMSQLESPDIGFENTIRLSEDGGIWLTVKSNFENKVYKFNDDIVTEEIELKRFPNFTVYDILDFGEAVFFSGPRGILGYNQQSNRNYGTHFPVSIREVLVSNDSLLFAGHFSEQYVVNRLSLPFRNNTLQFTYALPDYNNPDGNQYQYYLEGFDENWSEWTSETQRYFTNLPEGEYLFRVRGQNIYGQISEEAAFAFTILAPWHRTWWAYALYGFILLGFIAGIVHWRSHKLQKEKEVLQNMVAERTRKVKQQAEQLKELDQVKSNFFANISHEFRTPLTLILGQINQLESRYASDNPAPVYQVIKRNGQRLLNLVNQLLDLSTMESGKMKLQAVKTDLVSFMKSIVAAYNSLAESKGIEFMFEASEKSLPVYFDRDKMEKIIQNVVSNAFKFTGDGGRIIVKVGRKKTNEGDTVQIEISDTGKGISPEYLDKVFDRFYRGDSSNTDEGSGIGLALAKELVTLHKGTISVESTVGEGACFTIVLPVGGEHFRHDEIVKKIPVDNEWKENEFPTDSSVPETIRRTPDSVEIEPVKTSVSRELPRILIVEDNVDMRQYIRQILQPGYKIAEASNGTEGWEKAAAWVPDLVISDVMMPETDGFELCKKLKNDERTSHIPVVLLTAKAGKESKIEGLETRADDYLTKPFDREELLILIRNRIEQRTSLRKRFSREVTVQPKDITITSADERFLQKAIDVVEKHMEDFDFNVETFVEQMHLGHTQVNQKIKALTDLTPVQFIRFLRLKRAAQKIARQEDTVSQIAYSVGFNNLSYFSKCFKEQFGQLPSEYTGE